jgi:hypothetical protein
MTKSEFDALPIGAKLQCEVNGNLYQKTGTNEFVCIEIAGKRKPTDPQPSFSFHWANRPDGFWSSLIEA